MWRLARFAAGAVAMLALAAPPARGEARSVAVLGVTGSPEITARVTDRLGDFYQVVDGGQYRAAAQRLGRMTPEPADVAAVAAAIRADAIVAGSVLDGGARLRIIVRDGGTGQVVARLGYQLMAGSLTASTEGELAADLVDALARVRGVSRRPAPPPAKIQQEEEEEVEEEEPAPPPPPRRRRPAPAPEPRRELDDEAPPGMSSPPPRAAEPEPAPAEEEDEPPPRPSPRRRADVVKSAPARERPGNGLTAGAGLGLLSRSFDLHAPGADGYRGGAVAALRFDVALYPFAWGADLRASHPVLSTFGVEASWIESLPFQSVSSTGTPVDGRARRYQVALTSRIPLGSPRAPILSIATGYGSVEYASSDPVALGIPDVAYHHFTFGAGLEIPFGTPRVSLGIAGSAMAVFDAGAIADPSQFGPAGGWGVDGAATFTVRPLPWLFLRAGARVTTISIGFDGGGARLGTGAQDTFFDGMLEAGLVAG